MATQSWAPTAKRAARIDVFMKTDSPRTYVLTIDVEIDAGPKWKTSNPASYEGVYKGIEVLQHLCESYGVKPVYLISPAVMVDQKSVDVLKSLKRSNCELGTHLYGEYIPPKVLIQQLGQCNRSRS
jgi:hypothetical protein